jgi:hypothetical protein
MQLPTVIKEDKVLVFLTILTYYDRMRTRTSFIISHKIPCLTYTLYFKLTFCLVNDEKIVWYIVYSLDIWEIPSSFYVSVLCNVLLLLINSCKFQLLMIPISCSLFWCKFYSLHILKGNVICCRSLFPLLHS